ncbi:AMP-dependent synthetase/ligase [Mycetocola reblochoni]|uniref:Acyl-CoA synthetase n=2 Tax=Mycetocola reblochoni TaxID=331618 RepID=A0A1R4IHI8_9MICO|nr:AMP-dependent synthetase/ligase [Mycetocola reblochoni]RLP69638.1 long-chain fatty acid--CoA ligase [Mycetocola reblochoni]SJN19276.1 Long-chain-fatty-acid--CoA ligase [Mycetocola reblochoni REB411]
MDQFITPARVPADPSANTTDLLVERVARTPDRALFAVPDGDDWTDITARQFQSSVIGLAKGLIASGVEPGDRIALICKTSYEWSLIDFAVWYAGAILIPVYETSSPSQIQWIVSDSGATRIIVETAEHFARFDEVHPDLELIGQVWQLERGDLDKLTARGADIPDDEVERRRRLATADDIATIIYTSGSTGSPKGCVLTHANFVETSRNAAVELQVLLNVPGVSTLLFVTLAHVFARFISVLAVHAGVRTGHQPDTKKLLPSLGSFRPTFLLAVPRVFEKVYNSAEQKAEAGGKGRIFRAAAATAVEYSTARSAGAVPFGLRVRFAVFDRLVFAKLRSALGGRVQYAVSGSAPLGARLGHFFSALGVEILEGYGLTETTAPATVNLPGHSRIGTVGPPLPGVGVRISADGEVEVSGVNVFREYWNNPEATADAFDDGWLRTGDIGSLDDDGYLTITGRSKEIIVTAGGKNVSPAYLEDPIRANPLVGQIVVVGDQKPFIGALVTLDAEMLPTWLANHGLESGMSVAEAAGHPEVVAEIQRAVDAANERVSRAESIRKFTVLDVDFTEDAGHLTPKMSIKRHNIIRDYADTIDELYRDAPTQGISLS